MKVRTQIFCAILLVLTSAALAQVPQSKHVIIVAEENHSYSAFTSSSMPYLYSLAMKYGFATNYYANTHPSIGNYFMLTTGQIITNNDGYMTTVTADNIVRHLLTAGLTWKSYAEGLPSVGYTGGDTGNYVRHHNPLSYFSDVVNSSVEKNNLVPFTQFASDLGAGQLPNFSFVVPNLLDDEHSGTAAAADNWFKTNIAPVLNTPAFQPGGDGLLIVWWDEGYSTDTANGGGHVPVVLIGPQVKGAFKSTTFHQHQSALRLMMEALGMSSGYPGAAASASDMGEFFGTSSTTPPPPTSGTPAVTITSPSPGATVSSPVTVNATFSNGGAPQYMKLWVDGVAQYFNNNSTTLSYPVTLAAGAHQVIVQAYNGTLYSSSENITVGTTPTPTPTPPSSSCTLSAVSPSVTICSPANNSSLGSPVAILAGSTDNASTVWLMQIYVDGTKQYEVGANSVNTSLSMAAGTHRITVQAYDKAGSIFKSTVYATVP